MRDRKKRSRRMFYAIEVNLVLWFAAFGASQLSATRTNWTAAHAAIVTGLLFALILQHWAYYSLFREDRP